MCLVLACVHVCHQLSFLSSSFPAHSSLSPSSSHQRNGTILTFKGKFKLKTSLSPNNLFSPSSTPFWSSPSPQTHSISTPAWSLNSLSPSSSLLRFKYLTFMPNAPVTFLAKHLPIPPIPKIPNVLPLGSLPKAGILVPFSPLLTCSSSPPRHSPLRKAVMPALKFLIAPSSKNKAQSAVASSTAEGVLDTLIPRAVQAGMLMAS